MTREELGIFEDDPRSVAGAMALETLDVGMEQVSPRAMGNNDRVELGEKWGLEPDNDPRVVSTRAAIREERTFDAYKQSGAWTMQSGVEYSPQEH